MGTVKKKKEPTKKSESSTENIQQLRSDLDKIGDWLADVDDELKEISKLVFRMAKRLGMK